MANFFIRTSIEMEVEANNEEEAVENFWENLEHRTAMCNESIDTILTENMEIEKMEEERACTKCGKTSGLKADEDICQGCADERQR